MGRQRPLTTQSGRSRNRRNGYECSLPDDFNTRLADSCGAQRYFRYVPSTVIRSFAFRGKPRPGFRNWRTITDHLVHVLDEFRVRVEN